MEAARGDPSGTIQLMAHERQGASLPQSIPCTSAAEAEEARVRRRTPAAPLDSGDGRLARVRKGVAKEVC